jgi:CubicO group peptidase (beta-lactamase class C family)
MYRKILLVIVLSGLSSGSNSGQSKSSSASIDSYIEPYVRTGNFSGVVLVEKNGKTVFHRAYGFADREKGIRNNDKTQFHIASISMQFTAAAVLRLVDQGVLRLDEYVGEYCPGISSADKITIRDLLLERSGLPDINALPDYDEVLQHHQTAASLVAKIQGKPLQFEPGTKFVHEEHSAYNLLALIVEKKTGMPFAKAIERLVFEPFGLTHSGMDDDSAELLQMAKGYAPEGTYDVKPAKAIHWSGKTGNASAFTTASDAALWVGELFRGETLKANSREAVLDTSTRVGYGWMRGKNERFGATAYSMNGRAPGFASFVLYLPGSETTVVVLSNIYSSATTVVGYDMAAIALGLSYEPLPLPMHAPRAEELTNVTGGFQFGADFYQPNAKVIVKREGEELFLYWPSGDRSALIPLERDHFVDRSYWERVSIERDETGRAAVLVYGQFQGRASPPAQD